MKVTDGVKMQDFYRRWFERTLQNTVNTVHNSSLGNYTTAYNTWKRLESIRSIFREEINRRKGNLCILDAGCGDALPLFILASKSNSNNIDFYGMDASKLDITFAENLRPLLNLNNIIFELGNIEKLPYQDSFFDIVVSSEVLEHMEHAEAFLLEIKRVLKNNGIAIISTPNEDNTAIKIRRIFKSAHKSSGEDILTEKTQMQDIDNKYDEHINTRSIKSWKQTYLSTGFIVAAIKRHSILYGGYEYNRHRILFAFTILLDTILDYLPFGYNFSEGVTYKLIKK
jgi:2-polyprenyl-3-methyl-5-hydroxy-6-metoxy-1,4-benzoquinol methylase